MKKSSLIALAVIGAVMISVLLWLVLVPKPTSNEPRGKQNLTAESDSEIGPETETGTASSPILEIGTESIAWGAVQEYEVCADGRIYSGPTLLALLEEDDLSELESTMGPQSFDYSGYFDDPDAFDDEYTAYARRYGSDGTRTLSDSEYQKLESAVGLYLSMNRAIIGPGALSFDMVHFRPLHEWADADAFDLNRLKTMHEYDEGREYSEQHPDPYMSLTVPKEALTADEQAFFMGLRDRYAQDYTPEPGKYAAWGATYFHLPGDKTTVYGIGVKTDRQTGDFKELSVRILPQTHPFSDLTDIIGAPQEELVPLFDDYKINRERYSLKTGDIDVIRSLRMQSRGNHKLSFVLNHDGQDYNFWTNYRLYTAEDDIVDVANPEGPCSDVFPDSVIPVPEAY